MKYLCIFFALLVSSCTSLNKESTLYSNYEQYKESILKSKSYIKYFSEVITNNINAGNESQLLFSKYMSKELDHYERINNKIGCLTVNGVGDKNEPISFFLEYKNENKKWLISDIDVTFLEDKKNYNLKALCPKDVRVK